MIKKPTRFRVLLTLFILFGTLTFLFAIISQPLFILSETLDDAYPEIGEAEGRATHSNVQVFLNIALGAAVVIGIIFLFAFYTYRSTGGGGKDNNFG